MDWNVAEREAHMRDCPTLDECRRMGRTHYAYRWARTPWGCWSTAQAQAYNEGFDSAKEEARNVR